MYCPQCGNANDDSAAFCGKCGMDLQKYKEQWSSPAGDADAAVADAGAAQTADPGDAPDGAAQAQPQPSAQPSAYAPPSYPPPSAYPAPSAYPPPYQQQYQQYYQTPPYQQAPYQPAQYRPGYGVMPRIASHMGFAIVTLILCFWPTGIVAVVYASRVGNLLALGDRYGAQEASGKAKMWCWITFGIGVALWVFLILALILGLVAATRSGSSNTF